MKERPILFSAPMVRAILAGTKTQTRRVVKSVELARGEARGVRVASNTFCYLDFDGVPGFSWRPFGGSPTVPYPTEKVAAACPYGRPGDRLWVRETWAPYPDPHAPPNDRPLVTYRATDEALTNGVRWKPSIFMPRWASRITLEVTGLRVERLHAIAEADAVAEGTTCWCCGGPVDGTSENECSCFHSRREAIASYEMIWESINGSGSWALNPWVWVVEFRKVSP